MKDCVFTGVCCFLVDFSISSLKNLFWPSATECTNLQFGLTSFSFNVACI